MHIEYKGFVGIAAYCAIIGGYYGEVINTEDNLIIFLASNAKSIPHAMHQAVDLFVYARQLLPEVSGNDSRNPHL